MSFRRFSILGLGLIGGSLAMALRKRISGCDITAYDIDRKTLETARAGGTLDRIADSPIHACETAQCIIVCVPVGEIAATFTAIGPALKQGVCVTDVASVKSTILDLAQRLLPERVFFVGGHPMAGREQSGLIAAREDLFDGAICVTTPLATTNAKALEDVEAMWRSIGSRIVRLSPQEHDRNVAQISHLPHVLASALIGSVTDDALAIAGRGFRDLTRIAAGNSRLWRQILQSNGVELRAAIGQLRGELDIVERLLDGNHGVELENWLAAAAARRRGLGASGGQPTPIQ
jgi:prephenate dehydrogenase